MPSIYLYMNIYIFSLALSLSVSLSPEGKACGVCVRRLPPDLQQHVCMCVLCVCVGRGADHKYQKTHNETTEATAIANIMAAKLPVEHSIQYLPGACTRPGVSYDASILDTRIASPS